MRGDELIHTIHHVWRQASQAVQDNLEHTRELQHRIASAQTGAEQALRIIAEEVANTLSSSTLLPELEQREANLRPRLAARQLARANMARQFDEAKEAAERANRQLSEAEQAHERAKQARAAFTRTLSAELEATPEGKGFLQTIATREQAVEHARERNVSAKDAATQRRGQLNAHPVWKHLHKRRLGLPNYRGTRLDTWLDGIAARWSRYPEALIAVEVAEQFATHAAQHVDTATHLLQVARAVWSEALRTRLIEHPVGQQHLVQEQQTIDALAEAQREAEIAQGTLRTSERVLIEHDGWLDSEGTELLVQMERGLTRYSDEALGALTRATASPRDDDALRSLVASRKQAIESKARKQRASDDHARLQRAEKALELLYRRANQGIWKQDRARFRDPDLNHLLHRLGVGAISVEEVIGRIQATYYLEPEPDFPVWDASVSHTGGGSSSRRGAATSGGIGGESFVTGGGLRGSSWRTGGGV